MTNSSNSVAVKILGKEYQVACPADQTHRLIDAALMLDAKMKDIRLKGRVIGLERIAVMAALNLAHDLLSLRSSAAQNEQELDNRLELMCEKIDEVLT